MNPLFQEMAATLRGYWTQAQGYQRFLYLLGALLLLSAIFHTGVLIVTRGPLHGDVSWRKPILFGESFGLTALSLAWVMNFLPRSRVTGWLLLGTLGFVNLGEVFLVAMQQWRGVPSHFNSSTPFDQAVFALMGILILFAGVVILVVMLLTFLALEAPPSLAWAIRAGMLLLVASQLFGLLMIVNGGNTFGTAGAMKIPHALALHGAQVLPILAWVLLFAPWAEARRTRTVFVGALGYAGLVGISAYQALSGVAPFDLSFSAALGLGLSLVFLLGAYAMALVGIQQRLAQAAAATAP